MLVIYLGALFVFGGVSALGCAWVGTKSGALSRTKSIFGLQEGQRLKNGETPPAEQRNMSLFNPFIDRAV